MMGIFGLLKSTGKLVEDVADIVTAPVEVVVDVTRQATRPMADVSQEMVEELKEDE